MYNIAIFDDHSFVVSAISYNFRDRPKVGEIFECSTKDDLFFKLAKNDIHVVISDVLTQEDIGLSVFEQLQLEHPTIKVIAFTSIKNEFVVQSLKELGVMGVINKNQSLDDLYSLFVEVTNSKIAKAKSSKLSFELSPKEKLIVYHLIKGSVAKEVASATKSSVNTINNQKNELLKKFDCSNSTELVVKLTQLGLIDIL